ncbi:MAG TPA: type II toxin-antitoxin system HicB family antitoxin [Methanothrix sp.]|jgi:predicted RNase H-like HicB family nuclease|nr:type II toxin-antitoxin system HicB family antitoxin [Methanothrix sp.]HPC89902.1 type II toxin-antitoxin system HicB family antitoxin [Methanothrix sp.]HQE87698.1 type II toxin-antitoxin system HicB family antitoxin [Methanothrix sp.]HQI67487.1 type II toxin-antitoxin system HicB family antitoxin [Methanothrix sp.]HRS85267.1 type II toxin-antitoxin system HicB family antitoxin [Methanothrix sp.]
MAGGYTIELFYSEEDEGYIAVVPELPGCSAFGRSEEEALKEAKMAIDLWVETAKKENREVPRPIGREILKALLERAHNLAGADSL